MLVMGSSLVVSGLSLGIIKGWAFTLTLLAGLPLFALLMYTADKIMASGTLKAKAAYGQSSGYAE